MPQPWSRDIIEIDINVEALLATIGYPSGKGDRYFVDTGGSDANDGSDWDNAFLTIDYAVGQCTTGHGDTIYVGQGTYDEDANGAAGVTVDMDDLTIIGVGQVNVNNTDVNNDGYVFNVTADNCWLVNITVAKGEDTSTGAINIRFNGATGGGIIGCDVVVEDEATHTGIQLTGGCTYIGIYGQPDNPMNIGGLNALGVGIDFDTIANVVCSGLNIGYLADGITMAANCSYALIKDTCKIINCARGLTLEANAGSNTISANISNCGTDITDNSTVATNSFEGSITHLHHDVLHIPKFTGYTWYVDGTNGNDDYSGVSPDWPFATIGAGIAAAGAGDRIKIMAGTYDEDGLALAAIGLELIGEHGVVISNTNPGTCLTVTSNYCKVYGIVALQAGQIGFAVNGTFCQMEECIAYGNSTGFDLNGLAPVLKMCRSIAHTTIGIDMASNYGGFDTIACIGTGAATIGLNLIGDFNSFIDVVTSGNTTSGFNVTAAGTNNIFENCASGGADGAKADAGANNTWANFSEGSQIVAGQSRDQDLADIFAQGLINSGLAYMATVATIPGANMFTSTDLVGLGDAFFQSAAGQAYSVYVAWDQAGGNAAPQGEIQLMTAFSSATGQVTHVGFTVALTAGDKIIMIHPLLASLGMMSDAAAAGAVTAADTAFAYLKQLVTNSEAAALQVGPFDYAGLGIEEVQIGAAAATDAMGQVVVADLPAGCTVTRAILGFKFRMIENIYAGVNKLDGATVAATSQVIQIKENAAGAYIDGIDFPDDYFTLADSAREGGDVYFGQDDVSGEVDGNGTYDIRFLLAKADQDFINFNDVQIIIRVWYRQ